MNAPGALQALCDRLVAARPAFATERRDDVAAGALGALVEVALDVARLGAADVAALGALCESAIGLSLGAPGEPLAVRPSAARRTTGAHYTPPDLAARVVDAGLAPLLARGALSTRADAASSAEILALRVADPAMGAGAFLLAALDRLATALVDAWTREGAPATTSGAEETLRAARRAVATTCLFGIDKSPVAARVARRSIALVAGLDARAERALDRSLVCGDALVGMTRDALADVSELAIGRDPILVADLLVGAFFSSDRPAERARERGRRVALLDRWAATQTSDDEANVRALQGLARRAARPFHAALAWPRMDAVVGNPPFLGGKRVSTELGATFADWLRERHGASKNTDLAAVFLLLASTLAADRATINLITTNSIAEGETRRCGLGALVKDRGWAIYEATRSTPWPGDASVFVSIVHLARGLDLRPAKLDDRAVASIDSHLRSGVERPDPARLQASKGVCFIGCFLRGKGFVLDARAADALRAASAERDSDVVRPFLGGEEVNTSPTQSPHRFVIDLAVEGVGARGLEDARAHASAFEHLERTVKLERMALPPGGANEAHRARWFLFANPRPELRRALAGMTRCLAIPRVSPRLQVAWQPTDRVFSDQLCVVALQLDGHLALVQSRVHAAWAARHASTLGEGLRYTPSTCFETLPFPFVDPRVTSVELDRAGLELDRVRADALSSMSIGLTELGRRLEARDPDRRVAAVRAALHASELAVLGAYGWGDLAALDELDDRARFDAAVVERLLDLNEARALKERA